MAEFFVRVEVRESVDQASESNEKLRAAENVITAKLRELKIDPLASDRLVRGDVTELNGVLLLIVHGVKNHDNGMSGQLVELLEFVGQVTPGSYGFLWFYDHEFESGWTVHTLIRGTVTEQADPWFSPLIPTVEDPS